MKIVLCKRTPSAARLVLEVLSVYISKEFDEWIAIAKDRSKWRELVHSISKPPDASDG